MNVKNAEIIALFPLSILQNKPIFLWLIRRDASHYVAKSSTLSEYSTCVRQLDKLLSDLFDDHHSNSNYAEWRSATWWEHYWIANFKLYRNGRGLTWSSPPNICLERMKNATKKLIKDSHIMEQNLNPGTQVKSLSSRESKIYLYTQHKGI